MKVKDAVALLLRQNQDAELGVASDLSGYVQKVQRFCETRDGRVIVVEFGDDLIDPDELALEPLV
jgi:hypothetical protein